MDIHGSIFGCPEGPARDHVTGVADALDLGNEGGGEYQRAAKTTPAWWCFPEGDGKRRIFDSS
jgi:hypothetical protein